MASKKIPSIYKKLVSVQVTQKFREAVRIVSAELPKPGTGEVILRNKFVGINASDINFTAGRYFTSAKPPYDVGFEGLGEVVLKGEKCEDIEIGQHVAYIRNGAFAEFVSLPVRQALPLQVATPSPAFVCLLISGMTAAMSLEKMGGISKGEKVLVTAAAGGTGQFAVQWAKKSGCHVLGTCSSNEKVDLLKSLGCDRPININEENLKDVLRREYSSGVDVIYETVGGDVFDACVDGLAEKGRLIVIGQTQGYQSNTGFTKSKVATLPIRLLQKSSSVRGFMLFHFASDYKEYFAKMSNAYLDGSVRVTVDNGQNHPNGPFKGLESIADAVEHLYSRKSKGKIVVKI